LILIRRSGLLVGLLILTYNATLLFSALALVYGGRFSGVTLGVSATGNTEAGDKDKYQH
jgi:hypothetical protein